MTQDRLSAKNIEYQLYTYEVIDDMGNMERIDSLKKYQPGEEVEVWFNEKYNKPAITTRQKCDRCHKKYYEKDAVNHEFCAQFHY